MKMLIVMLLLSWTVLPVAGAFGQEIQHVIQVPTQDELATSAKAMSCWEASDAALNQHKYALAESDARKCLSFDAGFSPARQTLASALLAQGRTHEAVSLLEQISKRNDLLLGSGLPYALVLVRGGHWADALSVYGKVFPLVGTVFAGPYLLAEDNDYSVDDPQPVALEADIHIALGTERLDDYGITGPPSSQNIYDEFKKAYTLEPDSPLAKLYYAKGLYVVGKEYEARTLYREVMNEATGDIKSAAEDELGIYVPPPPDPNAAAK